jgi:hypothetical protein
MIIQPDLRFARNVLLKAGALFIIANLLFALLYPLPALGRISIYNRLVPGRQRLPYGDNPEKAYNLSLYNLEAMFASHEISARPKPADEYRVILIGDSSTWGFLLPVDQTLSAYLNTAGLTLVPPDLSGFENPKGLSGGKKVRFYNLGYPVMSLAKDLLLLSYAQSYQPDLILWLVTLESFPYDKQLYPPLLQNNPIPLTRLVDAYHLNLNGNDPSLVRPGFRQRTLLGARRPLADLVRLQLYGVLWAATRVDQDIPLSYTLRQEDLADDLGFHNLTPPHLQASDLAFDVLSAGVSLAGPAPVILINEPMFISQGLNSQIRYNFYYPRWAYDDYRQLLAAQSAQNGWNYRDFWDAIPPSEFSNSAVHLTASGNRQLAALVAQAILETLAKTPAH